LGRGLGVEAGGGGAEGSVVEGLVGLVEWVKAAVWEGRGALERGGGEGRRCLVGGEGEWRRWVGGGERDRLQGWWGCGRECRVRGWGERLSEE